MLVLLSGGDAIPGLVASQQSPAGAAPERPQLPANVRDQVRRDQAAVDRALAQIEEVSGLRNAVAPATRILDARRQAQGEAWWETVDARRQLEDLRLFAGLSPEGRHALADVSARLARVVDPARNKLIPSIPDELRSIARALADIVGPDHPSRAMVLWRLSAALPAASQPEVESLRTETVRIVEGALGGEHPEVATALNDLGMVYYAAGRYREAEPLVVRARDIRNRALPPGGQQQADSLTSHGLLAAAFGRLGEAEADYKEAAAIYKSLGAPYARAYASVQNNLAVAYSSAGRDEEARALYEEVLKLSPNSTEALLNLASAYVTTGAYDRAEQTATRGLTIIGATQAGRASVAYASALETMAGIERARARFIQAESRYQDALKIRERALGPKHPDYLLAVSRLASLRTLMGRYAEAEQGYRSVLDAMAQNIGEQHLSYAVTLNELALVYQYQKPPDYARAGAHYTRALDILKQTVGDEHPAYVTALHNLASVYHAMGGDSLKLAETRYAEARRLLEQHPLERRALYATVLDNTARLYTALARYDEAEALSARAIEIRKELFGTDHPAYATSLGGRAAVLAATGRDAEAASLLLSSARADWAHVTTNLPFLNDEQKKQFLSQSEFTQGERLWSLVFDRHQSAELGVDAALLRKHLLFEAARQESGALRAAVASAPKDWREQWDEQQRLRRQLAAAVLDGSTANRPVRELTERLNTLEERLRRTNADYARSAGMQEVAENDVVKALRPGDALIEFVLYRPFDFTAEKWGDRRYGAFVVRSNVKATAAIDLGAATSMDEAIVSFRDAMERWAREYADPSNGRIRNSERAVGALSSAIRDKAWEPLRESLAGVTRVYVAPDGLLSLVPFEALAQDDGGSWKYLVEQTEIVYLASGRDLARLARTAADPVASKRAVLVGNPDFDLGGPAPEASAASDAKPDAACDEVPRQWQPYDVLTALITDAQRKLVALGWDVTTLLHDDAREGTVLGVNAPRILQFGTHGHYLKCRGSTEASASLLSRSMLMLAGANKRHVTGTDVGDGILTAFEVSGMNLQGTELVNLTACETALGDVTPDGVAGFRQAFLWAGARAVTMSMWEVPAVETTSQLEDFYTRWLGVSDTGTPRTRYAAFRGSQLEALARARAARESGHPFFWAGTVFIGDPGDLPGSAVADGRNAAAGTGVNFPRTLATYGQIARFLNQLTPGRGTGAGT